MHTPPVATLHDAANLVNRKYSAPLRYVSTLCKLRMGAIAPRVTMFQRADSIAVDAGQLGKSRSLSPVTRTGIFLYRNEDGSLRRELRHPDWVFHPDSLASMQMMPLTLGHPDDFVTDENFAQLAVGTTGDTVVRDGEFVKTPIRPTRRDAKLALQAGIRELSCGYTFTGLDTTPGVWNGMEYDTMQIGPYTYNHVALVSEGRAGSAVRYMDGVLDAEQLAAALAAKDSKKMEMKTIQMDGEEYSIPESMAALILKLHAKMEAMAGELEESKAYMAKAKEMESQAAEDAAAAAAKTAQDAADSLTALTAEIAALDASLDVTGKSADYIQARIDAIKDRQRMDAYKPLGSPVGGSVTSPMQVALAEFEKSQKDMQQRIGLQTR